MEVLACRLNLSNNMYRNAANALSSLYIKTNFGNQHHVAFRVNNLRVMVMSSRLGSFRSRSLLAWSTSRSPFLFDTFPLFRPTFRLPLESSPAALLVGCQDPSRWYSAQPLRDQRLKADPDQRDKVESVSDRKIPPEMPNPSAGIQTNYPPIRDSMTQNLQTSIPSPEIEANSVNSMGKIIEDVNVQAKEEAASTEIGTENPSTAMEETKKPGILKRFKMMYKQYGVVLVGVHLFTSSIWTGIFFYAATSGVDVVPVLRWMGASDVVISPFLLPGVGYAAVTYLMYKLATPARYTVTIAGTQLAVRYLRKYGYLKQPETVDGKPDSLKSLVKDGKEKVKDKMEVIREDMHELKDKIEHIRDRAPTLGSKDEQLQQKK